MFSCGNIVPIMESFPVLFGREHLILRPGLQTAFPSQNLKTDRLKLVPKGVDSASITYKKACTVVVEVTEKCQLKCPVCFASAGDGFEPDFYVLEKLLHDVHRKAPSAILQFSGGEPTLRDDLLDLIRLASNLKFPGIQLNTNGLRLAQEPGYAQKLKQAGLNWVFLQFDGLREATYTTLRGRPLLTDKIQAIDACKEAGLGVVLRSHGCKRG